MTIQKVDNVWAAGVEPPPQLVDVLIETESDRAPTAPTPEPPPTPQPKIETVATDTPQHYRIAEQMDRVTDAALTASAQSLDAVQAAHEADENARAITQATEESIQGAQQAIEETHSYITSTNQAAERAIQAARAARQASVTAFEFTRSGVINLEEMEHAINSSEQRMQNMDSNKLFQRTQNLKQQTAALRQQLNNL